MFGDVSARGRTRIVCLFARLTPKHPSHIYMSQLSGRIALITGSSQGIGAGIARLFHAEGARVALTGLEEGAGRTLAAAFNAQRPDSALFMPGNLADPATCSALVDRTAAAWQGLDLLINAAADTSRGTLESTSLELFDRLLAVNLRAPFLLAQAALPHLRRSAAPAIVNIGSINAYVGDTRLLPYSISKGGLMTLTRNLAAALRHHRIRVNQINPGWTLTEGERNIKIRDEHNPEWLPAAVATRPFGRLLLPDDIARLALYLASDASFGMTGAVIDYEQFPLGLFPET